MHKKSNPILMSVLLPTHNLCVRNLLISHQSFFSASRTAPLCSSDTCSLHGSAVQVSQLASAFSHSMFQLRCSPYLLFSLTLVHQWHTWSPVPGRFAPNPFPPLDVSPPGRFAPGRFTPGRFAPTGRFAPWTFRPQISMRGGIGGY